MKEIPAEALERVLSLQKRRSALTIAAFALISANVDAEEELERMAVEQEQIAFEIKAIFEKIHEELR